MTPIEQVRLALGDPDGEYLQDSVIQWLLTENGNSIHRASIEALESIINNLALSPMKEESGGYSVWRESLQALEKRLVSLKRKSKVPLVPMVFNSDRSNWQDFDSLFN